MTNPQSIDAILSVYDNMPDLIILTNMIDKNRYQVVKEHIKDTSYGFSNATLLSLNKSGKGFNYPSEVDDIINSLLTEKNDKN